ncbi:universal stress protein [Streptomyces sp. SAS_272]|uniref:universal stress protein n=1 Tax=Streptomyces sp. SAS_272 TaxID=3412747 RepID=UPI00403C7F29
MVLVPDGSTSADHSGRVVVGVDARDPSDGVIAFAFGCARARGAGLHAVHAWSLPSRAAAWPFGVPEKERATWEDHEVQLLADALRPWREKYPDIPVWEDVLLFPPAQALLHHSGSTALVVVGHRSCTEWGAVVQTLLREAACPVAVVPTGAPPR